LFATVAWRRLIGLRAVTAEQADLLSVVRNPCLNNVVAFRKVAGG
jgi:hypothetical protein